MSKNLVHFEQKKGTLAKNTHNFFFHQDITIHTPAVNLCRVAMMYAFIRNFYNQFRLEKSRKSEFLESFYYFHLSLFAIEFPISPTLLQPTTLSSTLMIDSDFIHSLLICNKCLR